MRGFPWLVQDFHAPKRRRADCITCGAPFWSEHFGHRMCDSCRLLPTPENNWSAPSCGHKTRPGVIEEDMK